MCHRRRVAAVCSPIRPEPVRGCRTECTRDIGATIERGMWAMHAEPGELVDEAYSKAPIVTDTPQICPSAALVSTDIKEAGLWLWQGEAPPPPASPQPTSRDRQFLSRLMPGAGWAGWIAVPAGLALAFLAVSMIPRPDRPVSADTPAVALSSAPSPAVTPPVVPVFPAESTKAQPDPVQAPSMSPAAKVAAQGPEPAVATRRAPRKLSRTARKTHASHVRRGPLSPMFGVLTPPPMTWHGGGY
jgi:hypothetical protein